MKRALKLILVSIALSACFPMVICADDVNPPSDKPRPTGPTKVDFRPVPKPSRPHAPSMQGIEAYYDGESLWLLFAMPEGICTLIVESLEQGVQSYEFDSESEAAISIGAVSCAALTIVTEQGHTYSGAID